MREMAFMRDLLQRPRRLRASSGIRALVQETYLLPHQLIQPLFVVPGAGIEQEIPGLPGVKHYSVDRIVNVAKDLINVGVNSILLFGIPEKKDSLASGAYSEDGVVQQACRTLREKIPELLIITDCCLCAYTDHGHCGVLQKDLSISNDDSVDLLSKVAVSQARAGAHIIAPSDMMDGRIGAIRESLDTNNLLNISIMSYAVKYASAFYGPFRAAQDSAPQVGDRSTYQMDPANAREALREAKLDEEEGADILMVKPALPYLDILVKLRAQTNLPLAAYQVSGEYAMIKAASAAGMLDETRAIKESLLSIRRAGADCIISYAAGQIAAKL